MEQTFLENLSQTVEIEQSAIESQDKQIDYEMNKLEIVEQKLVKQIKERQKTAEKNRSDLFTNLCDMNDAKSSNSEEF